MASISKEALLKIVADDTDAEEKLERISATADKLREENPELTVRVDTAEASAKLAVFREELKAATRTATADVDEKTDGGKVGLLERLLYGAGGRAAFDAGTAGEGGGGAGAILNLMAGAPEALQGLAGGMLVIAPVIAAILVELTGVVAGLAAATAGIGAFGLLALPTLEGIEKAYTAVGTAQAKVATAQTAYNDAVEKEKLDPTTANATAAATALLNLKVAQEDLTKTAPKYESIITGIQGVMTEFKEFSKPLQPVVLDLINQALNLAASQLPYVAKLADAAAQPIEEVMGALSKSLTSNSFSEFIDKFSKISGPSIEAIGAGFIKVAGAFGHLMTVMSAHDVVHALNIAFDALAGTINGFADWVHGAQLNWDNFSGHMQQIAHTITANFQAMMAWFEGIPGSFAALGHQIEAVWDTVVSWFEGLPGKIVNALAALPGMLYNAGAAAVQHLIDGLGSKLGSLGSMAATLAKKIAGFFGLSPALEGPLSGSGAPEVRGQHFAADLARGMLSGAGTVGSAAGRLAGSIGGGLGVPGTALAGAGGAGQQITLVVQAADSDASQFIADMIKRYVHAQGGGSITSVQVALGQNH